MSVRRDYTIDIVRGIAIVIMVGANMIPFLPEPHRLWVRCVCSVAAPIFVSLAGTMLVLSRLKASQGFVYFVKRALFLLAIAAFVDVIAWDYVPFVGVDVLYVIGLSIPLLYLAANQSFAFVFVLAMAVFALTPLLQSLLGYAPEPLTPSIEAFRAGQLIPIVAVLKHWVVDGWFPVFPWLGYGFVGVLIGQWRWKVKGEVQLFNSRGALSIAGALIGAGLIGLYYYAGPQYPRLGYSELFYPATLGFVTLSVGAVLLVIAFVDATRVWRLWELFRLFGEASLFMYIAHCLVIGFCIEPYWSQMDAQTYWALYAALLALLGVCGHLLRMTRQKYRNMPVVLRWVVGA